MKHNRLIRASATTKAAGILAVLVALVTGCASMEPSTPQIVDSNGNRLPDSIAVVETVNIGGVDQQLTIRGHDRTKPVLLYLHGGPGLPSAPWATWRDSFTTLEQHFVLVHWDQRGAGQSYHRRLEPTELTIEILVADTLELSSMLAQRFQQEKIFLWGHSFGSGLGFEVLQANQEPFHAFFASGVRTSWDASQQRGFEMLRDRALEEGDRTAVQEMDAIGRFDPRNPDHIAVRQRQLGRFLVGDFRRAGMQETWLRYAQSGQSPGYPRRTVPRVLRGLRFSRETIGMEAIADGFDLSRDLPATSIPVHFFHGRHDYETPGELVHEYYEQLVAPGKSFTWLDDSAHNPMYDEPEGFGRALAQAARYGDG